ncbi:MAG: NADP oxidoreductase, partial [Proteobacteria bacterium]
MKPRLAVIGAGWLGGTVGKAWVKAGYEVMFSSRHPEELQALIDGLGENASVGTLSEAAQFGSILLFAVPGSSLAEVARDLRGAIE